MKTLTKWMLAALAATAVVGCDPFEKAVGGPPVVIAAGFTDNTGPVGYSATVAGSAWTVSGVVPYCGFTATTPTVVEMPGFVFVKFNKLLDGLSIQTTVTDCTPAAALGLAVTLNGGPPPAGTAWYACYNPQSPSPDEGASVIVFLGDAALPPSGWFDAVTIPASGTAVTTVHATGTVHDKEGATASFDVTANIDPDPGVPSVTFASVAATSVTVNWAPTCVTVTTYDVQQAPDVAGAPGTFANRATGLTVLTFGDTGLTTATRVWYRVIAHTAGGDLTSAAASVTPMAPAAAPTFSTVTSTSVTVNWTAVAGAVRYNVQRAPDVAGAPGTFATRTTVFSGTTYADPALANTTYWYRIAAVAADGTTVAGASASVTTLP